MRRDSPPPCSRWPSGLLQRRASKRVFGSKASNAAQMRDWRSRKELAAGAVRSLPSVAPAASGGVVMLEGGTLVNVIDHAGHGVRVGFGADAVSQVEDVSRCWTCGVQHGVDVPLQVLRLGEQCGGIQVALDGFTGAQLAPDCFQGGAP